MTTTRFYIKLCSLFCCLYILTGHLRGQTVYEINYKNPASADTSTVSAWFMLDRNGNGQVRLKYADGNNITELKFTEQLYFRTDGMPDTSLLYYTTVASTTVKGKAALAPSAVVFWFRADSSGGFSPWSVSSNAVLPDTANLLKASMLSNEFILENKELVLGYFDTNSVYYKNLFTNPNLGNKGDNESITLHLWVVASTADETLLPNVANDVERMQETFGYIANEMGFELDTITIDGKNYNKARVETFLSRAKANKNDIIVFYYSGHGFRDQAAPTKEFPFLDLRDPNKRPRPDARTQTMNIQDIYSTIVKKGARLNLVLSDCCNDTIETPKQLGPVQPPASKAPMNYVPANLYALFKFAKGNLLMTAASKDERAIITNKYDSYFTYFFVESLNSYLGPGYSNPSWFQVMDEAKRKTSQYAGYVTCPRGKKCLQTPRIFRR